MPKIVKKGKYLIVVGDNGEEILPKQTGLNLECSVNTPLRATVSFLVEPDDIDDSIEEIELYEKVFETEW